MFIQRLLISISFMGMCYVLQCPAVESPAANIATKMLRLKIIKDGGKSIKKAKPFISRPVLAVGAGTGGLAMGAGAGYGYLNYQQNLRRMDELQARDREARKPEELRHKIEFEKLEYQKNLNEMKYQKEMMLEKIIQDKAIDREKNRSNWRWFGWFRS